MDTEPGRGSGRINPIRIHPRSSVACFHTLLPGDLPENLRNIKRHGRCSKEGDCFCTNETWAWLTKGGETNALDDFCNSFSAVVTFCWIAISPVLFSLHDKKNGKNKKEQSDKEAWQKRVVPIGKRIVLNNTCGYSIFIPWKRKARRRKTIPLLRKAKQTATG